MAARRDLALSATKLIGPGATILNLQNGWPSLISVQLDEGTEVKLAAHFGPVHSMARAGSIPLEQRPSELRFQVPAKNRPPQAPPGFIPILIGVLPSIDGGPPAFVIPGNPRIGQTTRFTVRFPGSLAYEGAATGWAMSKSNEDEKFWAIAPSLLPAWLLAEREGVDLEAPKVRAAAQAAGSLKDHSPETKERVRIASTRLARSATFRKNVLEAHGAACVFCGLADASLLQAAHVYPVGLPGALDVPSNGLPACLHHHVLLDGQRIHIDSETLAVTLHPGLSEIQEDSMMEFLVSNTCGTLTFPKAVDEAAAKEWIQMRNTAFQSEYAWTKS